ncbi:hypothetical protein ACH4U5_02690 [Streptomyces sp. NPDC020858]|uniref:hypothetical protein n=1 Tax=Streptomyces sp. NPDC020858 TaxID=3365097 RepID=UPI0037AC5584
MRITRSGSGVTVEDFPGYEGHSFIIGFPAGGTKPNGFYVKAPDGQPVTATWLRRLPLDRLLRAAAEARAAEIAGEVDSAPATEGRPYGGGGEHLAKVAEVYQWATERNIPPRRAIATRWARSEATAGRWIAEARKKGVLPPAGK